MLNTLIYFNYTIKFIMFILLPLFVFVFIFKRNFHKILISSFVYFMSVLFCIKWGFLALFIYIFVESDLANDNFCNKLNKFAQARRVRRIDAPK